MGLPGRDTFGPVRVAAAVVAAGTLAGSVFLSLLGLLEPRSLWVIGLTTAVPFAILGHAVALVLWLVLRGVSRGDARRWATVLAAVAAVGLVGQAVALAPSYAGAHARGPADLVLMTSNLRLGQGSAADVVAAVRREHVQVLVLEEVTPGLRERLRAAGLDGLLPNTVGTPAPGPKGTLVFSTYRLAGGAALPVVNGALRVAVQAPKPFELLAVHASQPLNAPALWVTDHTAIREAAAAVDGPVVLAGDFNATLLHPPMRDLLHTGLRDAAREANSGWQPTWPSRAVSRYGSPFGLAAIDHVLVGKGFGVVSTSTIGVDGTDHRALVARLVR